MQVPDSSGSAMRRLLFTRQIAVEIAKNVAMGSDTIRDWRLRRPRTTISDADPAKDIVERYGLALPRKMLSMLGSLEGKAVAEIGPGDTLAAGFAMLAAGASRYTCLDRFPGDYGSAYAKGFYRGVKAAWPQAFPELPWPQWLDPDRFPEAYPDRVNVVKVGVEATAGSQSVAADHDVVCSYAVGEHVQDVKAFARTSFEVLRPGGVALHVVDFSQHFDWSRWGDAFLYLSISDRVWNWMGSNRGLPNRVRFHEFLAALESTGFVVETHGRRLADSPPAPQRLLPRFRAMPLDSVRTLDATFVCRRPRA
jgi:hypothetical protein